MILAGIDEAGYGPLLGPLVVGCCAFEMPGSVPAAGEDLPCAWALLRKFVSKQRSKTGRKLHVNDSKLVYSPGNGLKELEKSVLAMRMTLANSGGQCMGHLEAFLEGIAPHVLADLEGYNWYRPAVDERFPIEQDAASINVFANGLRAEMGRTGARCLHMGARVVLERQLNHLFDQTRNKGSALFSIAAIHLDFLLREYGDRGLVIFCDRQGGRTHYGSLLRLMFDQWSLEITRENDGYAEYRLTRGAHDVRLIFCEKAESQCLPVALASMICKYIREAMMRRFNAYWIDFLPHVAPTAGYYNDGTRFLKDIDQKRRELGISDIHLIRSR